LEGAGLFLLDSVSSDAAFTHPVQVPDGFPGSELSVPHPEGSGGLYIKLRDDPAVVNVVTLQPQPLAPTKAQSALARQPRHGSSSGPGDAASHSPALGSQPEATPAPAPAGQPPAAPATSQQVSSTTPTP